MREGGRAGGGRERGKGGREGGRREGGKGGRGGGRRRDRGKEGGRGGGRQERESYFKSDLYTCTLSSHTQLLKCIKQELYCKLSMQRVT